MKITRLKLKNFIGIYNGTGKEEIEINFPNNGVHMNMLLGKNGSGKSTILSQLTPFKDSFDDRKSLILPGKEGLKEIDIEHNGHVYNIKHIYGKTSSSFISEDGIELNENGGVRTFEDVIKDKFKLDKDYFKIGKIGSNTSNFIQFTTAQRKAYISTFVEAVQKYLDFYDIVSKKIKTQEAQIKRISDDLKKFNSTEEILNKITEFNLKLENTNTDIDYLTKRQAELNVEIKNLNSSLSNINYLQEKEKLADKEKFIKKTNQLNDKLSKEYSNITVNNIQDEINKLTKESNALENEINILNTKLANSNTNKVTAENSKKEYEIKISNLENVDIIEYETKIKNKEKENEEIEKLLDNKYAKLLKANKDKLNNFLDSFTSFMQIILEEYKTLNTCSIIPTKRNVELFFTQDFPETFGNYVKTINSNISTQEELLEKKNSEYSVKYSNLNKLEILKKRPSDCKINSCPFIADALKYSNLENELKSLEEEIASIKNSLNDNKKKVEELSDLKIAYSKVAQVFKKLLPRENTIYKYFIYQNGVISKFLLLPLNTLTQKYFEITNLTENYITNINKEAENNNTLKFLNAKYNELKTSEETRKYFVDKLEEENKIITEETKKINEYTEELNNKKKENTDITLKIKDLTNFNESLTEINTVEKEIESIKENIRTYEDLSKTKNEKTDDLKLIEDKLQTASKNKETVTAEITKLKAAEITVNNLNSSLKSINETYNTMSIVKDALNPKSGIPLIFIKSYLEGTETIANELLNIAFGGKFEIRFVPTASDFFIQVRCGENIIEDIKLASQGEISLTTISISLALIERSLGEYNILYLDEIDGPLDANNRESFINIINKQIEKLNLEQIFIISHNNAFDNCKMNLILLPGSEEVKNNDEFMKNKEVIFDATV